jgi:glycosyltransferase involved in cell wall biosynthesis
MAAGCPTIVSQAASLPEVCGDAALYFNPYDENDLIEKLLRITSDSELRVSLRNRGLEHARSFTWERCVSQTCDVINGLLSKPEKKSL